MSIKSDLSLAYIMGYDDALAGRRPNSSKANVLAPRLSAECHDKNGFDPDIGFECTVCGTMVDSYMVTPADTGHEMQFHYCPNCGRKIKED